MGMTINLPLMEEIRAITRREMKEGILPDNCITCYWLRYWFDNDGTCMGHLCSEKPEVKGSYEECCDGRLKGCPYEKEGAEMNMQQMTINDVMAEQKKPEAKKPGKMSQEEKIYRYMKEHGGITPLEAMEHLHCMRLGARIFDMREKGIMIENDPVPGTNYARYRLIE